MTVDFSSQVEHHSRKAVQSLLKGHWLTYDEITFELLHSCILIKVTTVASSYCTGDEIIEWWGNNLSTNCYSRQIRLHSFVWERANFLSERKFWGNLSASNMIEKRQLPSTFVRCDMNVYCTPLIWFSQQFRTIVFQHIPSTIMFSKSKANALDSMVGV